jgi:hypothetical protein
MQFPPPTTYTSDMRVGWAWAIVLFPATAKAQSLIPGPGQAGSNAALHDLAASYERQMHIFNAAPFGVSLDAFVPDTNDRNLVAAFLAQSATLDFLAFTTAMGSPRTVDDVISSYDEHGDLGMFGGVPAAADAFRYAVLRDSGAPAAEVDAARNDMLEAIASFHVYANVTGEPGTIARGIRRTTESGDPPEPLPASCANSWERGANVWRTDRSGSHPDWYWMDNTSKDQMIGYVFALGAFWDVVATDATIADSVRSDLQADALAMGRSLMQAVEVRPGTMIDLVIRDANGCITRHHDLNAREVPLDGSAPLVLAETSTNRIGFNALAALGIVRTLVHVSGDAVLRDYYYDELIAARGYPTVLTTGAARVRNMFANTCIGTCLVTNFSNVNMAFVSIYGVLRYETDPALRATYRAALESELWNGPRPHMGLAIQQALFNVLYAGYRAGATDDAQADNAAASLAEWPAPPYWSPSVENCDAAETAAGSCIGIDGTTAIILDDVPARGGGLAAETALPKHLRVPNNFEWRSDPRVVNGDGGDRLNPGGDFLSAYWLGRFLVRAADSDANVSPIARNRDGTGGPPPIMMGADAGVMGDAATSEDAAAIEDGATSEDAAMLEDAAASEDAGSEDASMLADAGTTEDASPIAKDAAIEGFDAETMTPPGTVDEGCACSLGDRPRSRTERQSALASWLVIVGALALVARRRNTHL